MSRAIRLHLLSAAVLCLVLFPADSHAAWEYYTWGGFDAVVSAWQKVALIFSDNAYKALFFSIITMGIFFAGVTFYLRAMGGLRAGPPVMGGSRGNRNSPLPRARGTKG